MGRSDPFVTGVLADLARGLRALDVDFCLIGALVPEFLLEASSRRMTNDADVTVSVRTLAEFEQVKQGLASFGFSATRRPYRLTHRDGGWVDLLPYSKALAPTGHLEMSPGLTFNMAGFDELEGSAVSVSIAPGLTLPAAPLPLYTLLKLVAYGDRKARKDLGSVLHCLRHYREDDDARYGLEHDGTLVPYEYTGAYLLGLDGRRFIGSVVGPVRTVLDKFDSPDAAVVGLLAHEDGRVLVEDGHRAEVFELFRWFRLAAGV
jgi:predicted nucleotidyltransferase